MKKIISIIISMMLLLTTSFAFAKGVGDWTNMKGFMVEGELVPEKITQTNKGIQISAPSGYYNVNSDNVAGVVYNNAVNPSSFTVDFTIDKISDAIDTWISLNLLDKKDYFHVFDQSKGAGFVTLMRPTKTSMTVELYENVTGFVKVASKEIKGNPVGKTYKVQVKKNKNGKYDYIFNNSKICELNVGDAFKGNKAYYSTGLSTIDPKPMQITVTKINGKALK